MNYDIVIIASNKDFHKISFIYDSIINNIQGYNKIYCFCPEYPTDKIVGIEYILDIDVFNIDMSIVKFRPNWIYQQYLKLLQNITLDKYLIIDADIIINKPLTIFDNNKPNFMFSNDTNSKPFFNYSKLLFDIDREYEHSFINEIMLFDRILVKELIYSKFSDYNEFILESNKIITNRCFISEYELYGNYIYKYHRDNYNYIKTRSLKFEKRDTWTIDNIKEYIQKYKNSDFDILSISSMSN